MILYLHGLDPRCPQCTERTHSWISCVPQAVDLPKRGKETKQPMYRRLIHTALDVDNIQEVRATTQDCASAHALRSREEFGSSSVVGWRLVGKQPSPAQFPEPTGHN